MKAVMAAVLVVEDNEALRKLVVMLLEQKGHKVLSASNGLEGLMVYTSYRAVWTWCLRISICRKWTAFNWRRAFGRRIRPEKSYS